MLPYIPILFLFLLFSTRNVVVGSPVASPAPSASAEQPVYMIFFKEEATQQEKTDYATKLENKVSEDYMEAIMEDDDDIYAIAAVLTEKEIPEWKTSIVEKIESANAQPDEGLLNDKSQIEARDMYYDRMNTIDPRIDYEDMLFLSQPKGLAMDELTDFTYDDTAGAGVTVYIFDSGINLEHEEFTTSPPGIRRGKISVLKTKRSKFGKLLDNPMHDEHRDDHGTCVTDRVVGTLYGSAKSANVKMVPWAWNRGRRWLWGVEREVLAMVLKGLRTIINDIKEERKKPENKDGFFPVLNLSFNYHVDKEKNQKTLQAWHDMIQELIDLDVTILASAGNNGTMSPRVNDYPALFAESFPSMIVVGAVSTRGIPPHFTQGIDDPLVKAFAPGTYGPGRWMRCAAGQGKNSWQDTAGTSLSA
ncbi:hypothetical protein NUU61_004264 [Penicillium alfredii]|uniref:Peptidase S8/S53 domain-containing protein n=1 Tax=Penicillium alfredii TaxID=1506179 RepID=A0A9W9FKW5_9EURO|nr:uncharacterized protein NUU61_004264 [Penicillium alfredii]KAJ5102042.1 hypothetical protein NUU61_004264 [Penicillium alfredii]